MRLSVLIYAVILGLNMGLVAFYVYTEAYAVAVLLFMAFLIILRKPPEQF